MAKQEEVTRYETYAYVHKIPHWRLVIDQTGVTQDVLDYSYAGSGTDQDPFIVQWIPNDARNPMNFSTPKKWMITLIVALATLGVSLVSSAYTGGIEGITEEFQPSDEVVALGLSVFVLGFAVGPLLWAPLSELYGRQYLFWITYGALTVFNAGCAGANTITTLTILRFFAGAFGSSPMTNAGATIADMFEPSQRGLATALFAAAPFLGPSLGPIAGGFLGMKAGWRWVLGFLAIFSGALWIVGSVLVPETYAPVLLRRRAQKLSRMTGKCYMTQLDYDHRGESVGATFRSALVRPWVLLIREPIVLLLSTYLAIAYGTLFMLFSAFPIVYQQNRGWNQGVGGLAFVGIMVGMMAAVAFTIPVNRAYIKTQKKYGGVAPPEARLPPSLIGSVAMPIGLFWFAWTNGPSIHWIVSIIAGAPFGFGMVLVMLSSMNYLMDSYTIFAASVLAASSILRSVFAAAFPLFASSMYNNLGIHWASSIPAFLALACVPFPFLFYKYGATIRSKCKFAADSAVFMEKLRAEQDQNASTGAESRQSNGDTRHDPSRQRAASRVSTNEARYECSPYDIERDKTNRSIGV